MNKSKVPMLGVAAFMEFLLFICTLKLADYNIYIWIVAAVLVVAFGMTIFRLITEVDRKSNVTGKIGYKL